MHVDTTMISIESANDADDDITFDPTNLGGLDVSHVAMDLRSMPQLPTEIAAKIQRLNLHGNHFARLRGIRGCTALRELVLSANSLRDLGDELADLQQLQKLDLTSNKLSATAGLKGLSSLRSLVR